MTADKQHQKLLYYCLVFFGLLSLVAFLALREHQTNRNLYSNNTTETTVITEQLTPVIY